MKRRTVFLLVGACVACIAVAVLATPWADHSTWRKLRIFSPDQRVKNFRAMDELFPSRTIHRGSVAHHFGSDPRPLPRTYEFHGEERTLDAFLDRTTATGLIVVRGDAVVAERYFRGATEDSPLTSWSVAKSVVSMLVGIAIDEKAIEGVDATLGRYAPELRGAPYGEVPFRHALTMSSGIRFTEDYENPFADIHTMFVRLYLLGDTGESAGHYLASRPREREPGQIFNYESSDTFAIGLAVRGAVHQSLSEYLERKVWGPLGMEYDATWNVDGSGMELSFCCLNVRLRDYAKLGRLFARRGDWDGQRIVSEAWVRQSTRPDAKYPPGSIPWTPYGYQYQWWIPPGSHGAFMAIGVWGQNLYVNPATGVVIVKTSVDPEFAATEEEHAAVFEAIDRAVASPG